MQIYIYGAGKNGKLIKEIIDNYYSNSISVIGYIDLYKTGMYLGIPIIDISQISSEVPIVLSLLNPTTAVEAYQCLVKHGIKKVYWFLGAERASRIETKFFEECFEINNLGNCILPDIEFHIADNCNLNCKGCSHFSPLFNESGAGFKERIDDLLKLKSKFSDILRLDILGGEPLINPELEKYVIEIRRILPKTFIQIYTNGLLIPSLPDHIMKCIKENNVLFAITEYKPTHQMMDRIKNKLDMYGIPYRVTLYDVKAKFNRPISLSANSKYPKRCMSDGCIILSNGCIARCPTLMYIEKFNETFHTDLPSEGIFNLDDFDDGNKLLEELRQEVPLCKHCIDYEVDWAVCGREIKLEDFAVED